MTLDKEPKRLGAYSKGFLFMPTAGMRLAPEILVLELFREACFAGSGGAANNSPAGKTARKLDPDLDEVKFHAPTPLALSGLYGLRGRKIERGGGTYFYAPAYPAHASLAWLRRKSDRVVRDFFYRGALGVATSSSNDLRSEVARKTALAIHGDSGTPDVFKRASEQVVPPAGLPEQHQTEAAILSLLGESPEWGLATNDALSGRICSDWLLLCELEPFLPRIAWVGLVSTFLRVSVPIWMLAQLRVMEIFRDCARAALSGAVPTAEDFARRVEHRSELLLTPTLTLTDAVDESVSSYMRARCEVNLLFLELSRSSEDWRRKLSLPLSQRPAAGNVSMQDVLEGLRGLGSTRQNVHTGVLRAAEVYGAFVDPLKKGQGKNLEEFFRVLRNDHVGASDDGYLLERGPKNRRLFRIFPAPQVLSLFALLAHAVKCGSGSGTPRLLLSDLENHFRQYGIDFARVGGARAKLLRSLSSSGILRGTPDAGEGVQLSNPYQGALDRLTARSAA